MRYFLINRFQVRSMAGVLVLMLLLLPQSYAAHYKVYLIGGQSNAAGRGDAAELTPPYDSPQTDVAFYWHKTLTTDNGNLTQNDWVNLQPDAGQGKNNPSGHAVEFGPELTFGRTLADMYPAANIAIIKYAHGGSNLHTEWSASGDKYSTFITTVEAALTALVDAGHTYELIGMIWQQGEADTGGSNADNYEVNLTDLIARVRADLFGGLSLPFVVGGLSSNQYSDITVPTSGSYKVRLAQETVAQNVDGVGFANADNCDVYTGYEIHFNAAGQLALGAAHAAEMIGLEALDVDYDGLSATQETALGTNPGNPDSDNDGQKDGFEYRAGTDPLSSNSLFKVTGIVVATNQVSLTWPSKPGNKYRVIHSSTLSNEWTDVDADVPAAATGSNTVWTSEGSEGETGPATILALYDAASGLNGDFNTTAFDSADTEVSTTATRLAQGGSLSGGGANARVLSHSLFNTSDSGPSGFNLADVTQTSRSAAAAAGDWFSFTLQSGGSNVNYEAFSFYTDQTSSGTKVDLSYTIGTTETFILQGYEPPGDNSSVVLVDVDFADFSSTNDTTWTFYLYGGPASTHGTRFDDITLYGTSDAAIEEPEEPSAIYYRINLN